MKDHYSTLGLVNSAGEEEIRRAYRILARRYHPDVNPGRESQEKFQDISEAYRILSDGKRRAQYDSELENARQGAFRDKVGKFQEQQRHRFARSKSYFGAQGSFDSGPGSPEHAAQGSAEQADPSLAGDIGYYWGKLSSKARALFDQSRSLLAQLADKRTNAKPSMSVVEVSISVQDALRGLRKKIEISEGNLTRRVSVSIPPGVRDGSVTRLRNKDNPDDDLVIIIRLASHPFLNIRPKGLIVEVPLTLDEAVNGCQIAVPGLEEEVLVKIPPGTQSGSEIRIGGKGLAGKDGSAGDLFVRPLVQIPDAQGAVGFSEKVKELQQYYSSGVRSAFPKKLL